MNQLTRRSFVRTAMLASASAAFASLKMPVAHFPVDPRSRLAVASYPFRAFIAAPHNHEHDPSKGTMDLAAFALFVRDHFKVRWIEPLDTHFFSTEPDYIARLHTHLKVSGVGVANIPVDEDVDLCSDLSEVREHGNARYRRWLDIAAQLGSPSVRFSLPKCTSIDALQKALNAMRPTLNYAQTRGVVVLLENDDPVIASAARLVKAIKQADTPWLRALPDFANSLMGGDESFNAGAVQSMFSHAWSMAHVKDAEVIEGKRRTVSLAQLFGFAKTSGYRGFYSMESDSAVDPTVDTQHLIERSLALM
jgi:sugar phosphate isomerase/epimerase